jgi:uncharacterized protein YcfJ
LPINIIRTCFTYKRKTIIDYRAKKVKYYAVKAEVVEKTKGVKMSKKLVAVLLALIVGFGLLIVGCESDAQTGALLGAGAGALAGQAIGRNTQSTVIGTAVGAGAGYVIGNETDKSKAKDTNK